MGLNSEDRFLVNRNVSTDPANPVWKSYQVKFDQLSIDIGKEITLDFPSVGYDQPTNVVSAAKFSSTPYTATGQDMTLITEFIIHDSLSYGSATNGTQILVLNRDTGEVVYYTINGAITTAGGQHKIPVKYDSGSGTLTKDDLANIRSVNASTGGGGSINVSPCPPGYKHDAVADTCTLITDPTDPDYQVPEIGTLWYNPFNGITYIWYSNQGDSAADGQWVDIRPGGGITGDDINVEGGLEIDANGNLKVKTYDAYGVTSEPGWDQAGANKDTTSKGLRISDDWTAIPPLT